MSDPPTPVPHPGPEPAAFDFPFAAAQVAAGAIDDAIAAVRTLVSRHESAAERARVGFEGRTRTEFDRGLGQSVAALEWKINLLDAQLVQLEDEMVLARRRADERETAQAEWQHRREAWEDAEAGP